MTQATFHALTVAELQRETDDSVCLTLAVPPELKDKFRFRQGQYLTFRRELDDQEVRRSYSICSSPDDRELRIAVKKVDGGPFSRDTY